LLLISTTNRNGRRALNPFQEKTQAKEEFIGLNLIFVEPWELQQQRTQLLTFLR
jgi:hypothetical protein